MKDRGHGGVTGGVLNVDNGSGGGGDGTKENE